MNDLNVLVIEQIPEHKELEKILINQGINTITIALQAVDVTHIANKIKPNVILFNTSQPT